MEPVTLWERKNARGEWEHNHLSDGHEQGERPVPKHPNHVRAWRGGEWRRRHAWLNSLGVVVTPNVLLTGDKQREQE